MTQEALPLYLGGALVQGSDTLDVINPATDQKVGAIIAAAPDHVDAALKAAEDAFPSWSTLSGAQRADWMDKLREAIAVKAEHLKQLVHLEMGKPMGGATEDFEMLLHSLEFYAGEARNLKSGTLPDPAGTHTHEIIKEPVGVVGAFLAWNFPLLNLAYKLGPTLAAGCPIIIKPSAKTPLSTYAVGAICAEIGLPAGVVNVIGGDDVAIGNQISSSPIPAMLTLIGSTQTGVHVMKTGATSIKRYSMELGGNAPVLVFEDADLDLAADIITALKFGNSGQICVAPNRVYADASISVALSDKILERAKAVKVGFAEDEGDEAIGMGPLIDHGSLRRIEALIADAVGGGASVLTGGGSPEGIDKGAFLEPTVLTGVTNDMTIASDEVFGPVINLMQVEADEEAMIAAANNTEAGLTAYIFTQDAERANRLSRALRFGEIQINGVKYDISLPHGGLKQSGIGVDCSHLALDDYFATKRISTAISG